MTSSQSVYRPSQSYVVWGRLRQGFEWGAGTGILPATAPSALCPVKVKVSSGALVSWALRVENQVCGKSFLWGSEWRCSCASSLKEQFHGSFVTSGLHTDQSQGLPVICFFRVFVLYMWVCVHLWTSEIDISVFLYHATPYITHTHTRVYICFS